MSDWSRDEVEATVADYFVMLQAELRGETYSKAEHRRNLRALLNSRSDAAIEFKHGNISAVLEELGCYSIEGYKRRSNYQDLLREVVLEHLISNPALRELMEIAATRPVNSIPPVADILSIRVDPPVRERRSTYARDPSRLVPSTTNYMEQEERNRSLGRSGEELVLRYERERLLKAGKVQLVDKIDHVSQSRGDRLGYDILSYEESGAPRLIEVKTTNGSATSAFFASRNEVRVSKDNSEEYHLYRLYRFTREPRLFVLSGALDETCELDPANYVAKIA